MRFLLSFLLIIAIVIAKRNSLCDICLQIVQTINQALEHGDDIKTAVHKFCSNLPILVNMCEKIVAQNLDAIITALKNHTPTHQICQDLSLC